MEKYIVDDIWILAFSASIWAQKNLFFSFLGWWIEKAMRAII